MAGWSEPTYSLTLDATGIRFYGSDARVILAEAVLSIESNAQVVTTEILKPDIQILVESNVSVSSIKIGNAESLIDGGSIVLSVATEIVKALIAPSASVSLSVSATKTAFSQTQLDISAELVASPYEILFAQSSASIESDAAALAYEILFASSNVSPEASTTASAFEILLASSSLSAESDAATTALEILLASTQVQSKSNSIVTSLKLAYSQSNIAIELTTQTIAYEILFASINSEIELSVQTSPIEILYATSSIEGLLINVVVGKEILFINTEPNSAATVLSVNAIKFSPNIIEDIDAIRPLFIIDNKPITEHNRGTTVSVIQSFIENQNWKASKNRYYKTNSPRKTFSINWSNLPSSRTQTADIKFGRDAIREIASDPDVHVLKFLDIDSNGATPYTETEYNVVVKNYSENLIRRDVGDDLYLWDCSLELEEV